MNHHLSPEEHVDAIEGQLAGPRAAHLATCEQCRTAAVALERTLREVEQIEAPEPSPLFWSHFAARVSVATSDEALPSKPWWQNWRRAGALIAAGSLAAIAFVFVPDRQDDADAEMTTVAAARSAEVQVEDEASWSLVIDMTGDVDLPLDEARDAVAPRAGTADALLDELTAEQREALVRLLEKEMGEVE